MFFDLLVSDPQYAASIVIAIILAVVIHEFCHAWMATYLGDPTARYMGRLSLNPLAHMDPVGTLMLFLAGFGWGKPVPFSLKYLKNPRLDAALIALAGPLSNLVIALIFAIPYRYLFLEGLDVVSASSMTLFLYKLLKTIIDFNLILMVFNLLPIPPLDGSKVFSLLLPGDYISKLYRFRNYGYGILLFLVFSHYLFGVNLLGGYILGPSLNFLRGIILYAG